MKRSTKTNAFNSNTTSEEASMKNLTKSPRTNFNTKGGNMKKEQLIINDLHTIRLEGYVRAFNVEISAYLSGVYSDSFFTEIGKDGSVDLVASMTGHSIEFLESVDKSNKDELFALKYIKQNMDEFEGYAEELLANPELAKLAVEQKFDTHNEEGSIKKASEVTVTIQKFVTFKDKDTDEEVSFWMNMTKGPKGLGLIAADGVRRNEGGWIVKNDAKMRRDNLEDLFKVENGEITGLKTVLKSIKVKRKVGHKFEYTTELFEMDVITEMARSLAINLDGIHYRAIVSSSRLSELVGFSSPKADFDEKLRGIQVKVRANGTGGFNGAGVLAIQPEDRGYTQKELNAFRVQKEENANIQIGKTDIMNRSTQGYLLDLEKEKANKRENANLAKVAKRESNRALGQKAYFESLLANEPFITEQLRVAKEAIEMGELADAEEITLYLVDQFGSRVFRTLGALNKVEGFRLPYNLYKTVAAALVPDKSVTKIIAQLNAEGDAEETKAAVRAACADVETLEEVLGAARSGHRINNKNIYGRLNQTLRQLKAAQKVA